MSKQISVHVKTRLLTPRGYQDLDRTWAPQSIASAQVLKIPLDAYGKNFIRIQLTEGNDLVAPDRKVSTDAANPPQEGVQ